MKKMNEIFGRRPTPPPITSPPITSPVLSPRDGVSSLERNMNNIRLDESTETPSYPKSVQSPTQRKLFSGKRGSGSRVRTFAETKTVSTPVLGEVKGMRPTLESTRGHASDILYDRISRSKSSRNNSRIGSKRSRMGGAPSEITSTPTKGNVDPPRKRAQSVAKDRVPSASLNHQPGSSVSSPRPVRAPIRKLVSSSNIGTSSLGTSPCFSLSLSSLPNNDSASSSSSPSKLSFTLPANPSDITAAVRYRETPRPSSMYNTMFATYPMQSSSSSSSSSSTTSTTSTSIASSPSSSSGALPKPFLMTASASVPTLPSPKKTFDQATPPTTPLSSRTSHTACDQFSRAFQGSMENSHPNQAATASNDSSTPSTVCAPTSSGKSLFSSASFCVPSDVSQKAHGSPSPWRSLSFNNVQTTPQKEDQPTLPSTQGGHGNLKYVSPETVYQLINGRYNNLFSRYVIVDSRFAYEYEGGHVRGAVHLESPEDVYEHFGGRNLAITGRVAVVFHCEFSSQRGPKLCKALRTWDRDVNEYPNLHYPDLFIMEGGYKAFFEQFATSCEPQEYITMKDSRYTEELKKGFAKMRRGSKKTSYSTNDIRVVTRTVSSSAFFGLRTLRS